MATRCRKNTGSKIGGTVFETHLWLSSKYEEKEELKLFNGTHYLGQPIDFGNN